MRSLILASGLLFLSLTSVVNAESEPTAKSYISLNCVVQTEQSLTKVFTGFLISKESDIALSNGNLLVSGRRITYTQDSRPELKQCRSKYVRQECGPTEGSGCYDRTFDRGWNALILGASKSVSTYMCGLGSVVTRYDSREAWVEAIKDHQVSNWIGDIGDLSVTSMDCFAEKIAD